MEGGADDPLVGVCPALSNLVVELVQVVDHLRRLLYLELVRIALVGDRRTLALDELAQPLDRPASHLDGASKVVNSGHYARGSILVAHIAEGDDVFA